MKVIRCSSRLCADMEQELKALAEDESLEVVDGNYVNYVTRRGDTYTVYSRWEPLYDGNFQRVLFELAEDMLF